MLIVREHSLHLVYTNIVRGFVYNAPNDALYCDRNDCNEYSTDNLHYLHLYFIGYYAVWVILQIEINPFYGPCSRFIFISDYKINQL